MRNRIDSGESENRTNSDQSESGSGSNFGASAWAAMDVPEAALGWWEAKWGPQERQDHEVGVNARNSKSRERIS